MHATWALLAPVLIGMLLLGGIALIVSLLANPRTRAVGVVLVACGAMVVVLGGLSMFVLVGRREIAREEALTQAAESRRIEADGLPQQGAPAKPALQPASKTVAPVKPTAAVPEPEPEKASGVLPAIGSSLAKAASETGVARASRSVQESPSVLAASLRALFKAVAKERTRPGSGTAEAPKPPAWVDAEPGMVGGAYQMTAEVTGLTPQQCDEAQPEELEKCAAIYVEHQLGPGAPKSIRLSPEFLQEHVVSDVWEETVTVDYGGDTGRKPTILRHVLLKFGPGANQEVQKLSRLATIHHRLRLAGYGLAALLAALGLAFAYLKINLATGGHYRGRLRAAAIAVILAAIAANALILAS